MTKAAGEHLKKDQRKRRVKNLLESVAVHVSQEPEEISIRTKPTK